jgi:hypothetical protein
LEETLEDLRKWGLRVDSLKGRAAWDKIRRVEELRMWRRKGGVMRYYKSFQRLGRI